MHLSRGWAIDLRNELSVAGATVLDSLDPERCTHLLVEAGGASQPAEVAVATEHKLAIVDTDWLASATKPAADPMAHDSDDFDD